MRKMNTDEIVSVINGMGMFGETLELVFEKRWALEKIAKIAFVAVEYLIVELNRFRSRNVDRG